MLSLPFSLSVSAHKDTRPTLLILKLKVFLGGGYGVCGGCAQVSRLDGSISGDLEPTHANDNDAAAVKTACFLLHSGASELDCGIFTCRNNSFALRSHQKSRSPPDCGDNPILACQQRSAVKDCKIRAGYSR